MQKYIFSMSQVSKIVPPKRYILEDISLSFFYGAKIGILGLNGSGKSTLLNIISGLDKAYQGKVSSQNNVKFGYLSQEPQLDSTKNVRENVEEGIKEVKKLLNKFNEISQKFTEPMDEDEMETLLAEQGDLQNKIDAVRGWEIGHTLEMAADALRLPPWNTDIANLSGGEKRRVALCRLLLSNPDVLLLDEPTNHLDAETITWLEKYLKDFPGTVIAITHDRYFLDNVAGWILELDRGRGIPFEGNYSAWLKSKTDRLAQEEKQESALQRTLKAELEWVRKSPKGKRSKNKARLARFEEINSKEFQKRNETKEIYIPQGPRLGESVLTINKIGKSFGDKVLIKDLSFIMPKGAIVGIVGPNGAGKSTLFNMLAKQTVPDYGSIHFGETVKLAYVDQSRDSLIGNKTVWEEISGGLDIITVGNFQISSRAYVGRFNFKGSDQQKLVKNLSGGERNRLHLAKVLQQGGNFLLLDEPSNDLDVETLRALEEALLSFPGCVMVISHDRWFLDRIATHILAFESNGAVTWFEGSYSEYEDEKKALLGEDALQANSKHRRFKSVTAN